jgi:hypothetical protein
VGGLSQDQYIKLNPSNHQLELTKRNGACLGGEPVERPKAEFSTCNDASSSRQIFKKELISDDDLSLVSPDQSLKYVRFEDASRPGLCLAATGGADAGRGRLEIHDCDAKSSLQRFLISTSSDGKERIEAAGMTGGSDQDARLCLDAGLGTKEIGLYPCYSDMNLNQDAKFVPAGEGTVRIEFRDRNCVGIPNVEPDLGSIGKPLDLHGCVSDGAVVKRGQFFTKQTSGSDPTVFALKNKDGNCLTVNRDNQFVLSKEACSSSRFQQDPNDTHMRLKHVPSGLCFDGNNGITPILYTCYDGDNTNQQIDVSQGFIKLLRTETCIDFEPVKPSPVTAIPCSSAMGSFKWEEYKPFVPVETQIYNRKKGTTDAPQIAAP